MTTVASRLHPIGRTDTTSTNPTHRLRQTLASIAFGLATLLVLVAGGIVLLTSEPPVMLVGPGLALVAVLLATWRFRLFGAVVLTLLVALPLVGAGYEAVAAHQAAGAYAPPGHLVDVGAHQLHLIASGSGGPTVVLEAGLGDTALTWSTVQAQLAERTRVLSYDRAGIGFSQPGPLPRDANQVTSELHALLINSGERGPYVLVGHSIGGLFARVYAARYPGEVAGLVLVDPESDSLDFSSDITVHVALRGLQRTGVLRAISPALAEPLGMSAYRPYLPALITASAFDTAIDEQRADADTQAESRALTSLGDLPLTVLSATANGLSPTTAATVRADHARYGAQSSRGKLMQVDTGHYVYRDNPEVVIQTIESLLDTH